MKKISDVYREYRLMPLLSDHQLRVAAVAKVICDSIKDFPETNDVVKTCFVHDMGNIIKFDLGYFPEAVQPEGLAYWEGVKSDYVAKYGTDEHVATQRIIAELNLDPKVTEYANQVGFSKLAETAADPSLAKKICAYADMRVGPYGVISAGERLIDGRKRYAGRADRVIATEKFETCAEALKEIERDIFSLSSISPEDITEEKIAPIFEKLKDFEI